MSLNDKLHSYLPMLHNYEERIGLEFECETSNPIKSWHSHYWIYKEDNSLRNGLEWITTGPITNDQITAAVEEWFLYQNNIKNKIVHNSPRTSIHVHRSIMNYTLLEIYTFLTAYYLIEPLLVRYCGKQREGNLFCLRMMDADYSVNALVQGIQKKYYFDYVKSDDFKYAALNLQAITKYGSLEFRMKGGDYKNKQEIIDWITMLDFFVKAVKVSFGTPRDVATTFKALTKKEFLYHCLPEAFANRLVTLFPDYRTIMEDAFHYIYHLVLAHPTWQEEPKKNTSLKLKKPLTYNEFLAQQQYSGGLSEAPPTIIDPVVINDDEELTF